MNTASIKMSYSDEQSDVQSSVSTAPHDVEDEFPNEDTEDDSRRSRNWCFTWNKYPEDHKERLAQLGEIVYMIYGYELGKKKNTPHLQGFVMFKEQRSFGTKLKASAELEAWEKKTYGKAKTPVQWRKGTLKGTIPEAYWKPMFSTPERCIKYCKKEGNSVEQGKPPIGQGKSSKLRDVADLILAGTTVKQIAKVPELLPLVINHHRGLQFAEEILRADRTDRAEVYWLYGESGTGKTRVASQLGAERAYVKDNGSVFWNGYDGEDVVIINEYYPKDHEISSMRSTSGWSFPDFLQVIDRYAYKAQTKGGHKTFDPKLIVITSIYPPESYHPSRTDFVQIYRRLTAVYKLLEDNTHVVHLTPDGARLYDRSLDIPDERVQVDLRSELLAALEAKKLERGLSKANQRTLQRHYITDAVSRQVELSHKNIDSREVYSDAASNS